MKKIQLSQGKVALVDDEDFEELNRFKWYARKHGNTFYAWCASKTKPQKTIYMHREILKTPRGMDTDHRDGNGLNNQRSNLRIATRSQNLLNSGKHKNNTSGFKGVSWYQRYKKWHAQITVHGKNTHLGYFISKIKAHEAYTVACIKYHGNFAQIINK